MRTSFLFLAILLIACFPTSYQEKPLLDIYYVRLPTENGSISWALDRIDQRKLPLDNKFQYDVTGKGVSVYVFDSGVAEDHPELRGRVRLGFPFADRSKYPPCNPHGTSVASAVAGTNFGVATDVEIVDIPIFDCMDQLRPVRFFIDKLERSVDWVIYDYKKHNQPAIVNWSFFADFGKLDVIDRLTTRLTAAGMAVIVSAGNTNVDACGISPANSNTSLTVGSTYIGVDSISSGLLYHSDFKDDSSAYGDCVDVYAPGVGVFLASLDSRGNAIYQKWDGTSMSTGYVSGAAALFLEKYPKSTPTEVSHHIRCTATKNIVRNVNQSIETRFLYIGDLHTRCGLIGKSPASEAGHHIGSNPVISILKQIFK